MEKNKPGIYVEQPSDIELLKDTEIEVYQHKYHLTEDEIRQAFVAVGSNKMKLKDFLESKGSQSTSNSAENPKPETAINPNPGANSNIENVVEQLSPEQIQSQKKATNNEVTDGEDG